MRIDIASQESAVIRLTDEDDESIDLVRAGMGDDDADTQVVLRGDGTLILGTDELAGTGLNAELLRVHGGPTRKIVAVFDGADRGGPGFTYRTWMSDTTALTTNGQFTANGEAAEYPRNVADSQGRQYMFGASTDGVYGDGHHAVWLSCARNNIDHWQFIRDPLNGNGDDVDTGHRFRIGPNGELGWSDGVAVDADEDPNVGDKVQIIPDVDAGALLFLSLDGDPTSRDPIVVATREDAADMGIEYGIGLRAQPTNSSQSFKIGRLVGVFDGVGHADARVSLHGPDGLGSTKKLFSLKNGGIGFFAKAPVVQQSAIANPPAVTQNVQEALIAVLDALRAYGLLAT